MTHLPAPETKLISGRPDRPNEHNINPTDQTNQTELYRPQHSALTPWGEIFHLGAGKETSVLQLANLIQRLSNKKVKISFAPERKGEIKRNYSEITKARKIIGFNPQIVIRNGIREVYKWFKTRDIMDVKNAQILSWSE